MFSTENAQALISAYLEATASPTTSTRARLGPCSSASYPAALIERARLIMESDAGRAYVRDARASAIAHLAAVDPRLRALADAPLETIRQAAECTQDRHHGRVARWKLAALLSPRQRRFAIVRSLKRQHKKHIEPAVDIIDAIGWMQAIAAGDP